MKRARSLAPLLAALLAAALSQWPALRAPFFADDWLFLDQVRMRPLLAAALSPDPIGNFFRPLGRVLWFWTLGHASGESAVVFHAANLLLWLASVALLWGLAHRLAGARVAAVAAGVFAVTYAADVPVMWASGSQDLLALTLALGALFAMAHGRVRTAAVLLFVAPFAKETAVVAVLPALLLAHAPGEKPAATLRRAWPLLVATLAWGALTALVVSRRHVPGSALVLSQWGPLAAFADVIRVALGLEWRSGGAPWAPFALPGARVLAALAAAGAAVALAGPVRPVPVRAPADGRKVGRKAPPPAPARAPARGGAWLVAAAWVVAGAAPVALVAPLWSAYYFLFAMAGVALLAGLATERASGGVAAAVVLAAGLAAHQARTLDEFATAPSPWSGQSHVSRFYLERGMSVMQRCVDDLRAARPTVPKGSTFLFGGLSAFAAVQVGDGPLVRGVYRDTTLRSHYLSTFKRSMLGSGPVVMLFWDNDARRLVDRTGEKDLWFDLGVGYLLDDHPAAALEAFEVERSRAPQDPMVHYALAISRAADGDSAGARELLAGLGMGLLRDSGELVAEALRAMAAGDSNAARRLGELGSTRAAYDPRPHILLSRIHAGSAANSAGVLEAAAAMAFAPGDAAAWRNWAAVQQRFDYYPQALSSLDRYFALAPSAEADDAEAKAWREQLRQRMPGGIGAQRAMKADLTGR